MGRSWRSRRVGAAPLWHTGGGVQQLRGAGFFFWSMCVCHAPNLGAVPSQRAFSLGGDGAC
eukprot:4991088-Prymnesium_polylepis.1